MLVAYSIYVSLYFFSRRLAIISVSVNNLKKHMSFITRHPLMTSCSSWYCTLELRKFLRKQIDHYT